jgi:hypothetical protein
VKVIYNGTVQYIKPDVKDNPFESAVVNKFQDQVKGMYIDQLKRKDQQLFSAQVKGPLHTVFKQMDFKPLVSDSFGEMSTNVKHYINLAVDYGVEHLGRKMVDTTVEAVKTTLRRRYKSQLTTAN